MYWMFIAMERGKMKIKFHGIKNMWSNKDKPMMGKYFTFQIFSVNYIEKANHSSMLHVVVLNLSFIWIINEIMKPKLNIPVDEN